MEIFENIESDNAAWLVKNADRLQRAGLLDVPQSSLTKMNTSRRYTVYKRLLTRANEQDFVTIGEHLEYIERRKNGPVRRFLAAIGLVR